MPVLRSSSANARSLHRLCDSCMAQRNLAARDLSAHHEPQRHFLPDVAVSVSQHLQAWFDSGSQPVRSSTRGRRSARLRLSGPPGGPPPRPRLLDRSSREWLSRISASSGHIWPLLRADGAMQGHGSRCVVTTSITASRPALGAHAAPSGLAAGRSVVTLQTTMQSSTVWWDDARPVACGGGQRA